MVYIGDCDKHLGVFDLGGSGILSLLIQTTFVVEVDLDKCFSTACSVNPDQDEKFPFFIAMIHVDLTGLKHAA
jgi:hypothetical protein